MHYISGEHALNLPCSLETCGDWHRGAYAWIHIDIKETNNHPLKEYGIETCLCVPNYEGIPLKVANHIRACLDLMLDGSFISIYGMKNDFIVVSQYDSEIFSYALYLTIIAPNGKDISNFMLKEYGRRWFNFEERYYSDFKQRFKGSGV